MMNQNCNEVTTTEVKGIFESILLYAKLRGYIKQDDSIEFFGSEEWMDFCNDNNEDKCPEKWVGNTDNTDPSILVVPIGTVMDQENPETTTWGVFRNANINHATDFLVSITSFNIPHERYEKVAELTKQMVLDR